MMSLFFVVLKSSCPMAYKVLIPSFIVVRHQMTELTWGRGLFPNIEVALTSSKIGLKYSGAALLVKNFIAKIRNI